jgi:hypothetical protein
MRSTEKDAEHFPNNDVGISYEFWQRHFSGAPRILGRSFIIDFGETAVGRHPGLPSTSPPWPKVRNERNVPLSARHCWLLFETCARDTLVHDLGLTSQL